MTTRSASLPTAMDPIWSCLPNQIDCPVQGADLDGLDWREASLDQEFDLALITESGNDAPVSGGIRPCQQESSGRNEGLLHLHISLE
jgi:hypothetical protein